MSASLAQATATCLVRSAREDASLQRGRRSACFAKGLSTISPTLKSVMAHVPDVAKAHERDDNYEDGAGADYEEIPLALHRLANLVRTVPCRLLRPCILQSYVISPKWSRQENFRRYTSDEHVADQFLPYFLLNVAGCLHWGVRRHASLQRDCGNRETVFRSLFKQARPQH